VVISLACSVATAQPAAPQRLGAESRFGIDYVFALGPYYREEKWPRTLAQTGAGWVDFAGVAWRQCEPRPPGNEPHSYRWEKLDAAVRLWQKHGFEIVIWLRLGDGWFAGPIRYKPLGNILKFNGSDRLPVAERIGDYRVWVHALVERYDADGREDMPGLQRPILHYQCGNEYGNPMFWTGTLDDYVTLLKATCQAARTASPQVRIISNGLRWNSFFHGDPKAEKVQQRWEAFLARQPSDMHREGWQRNHDFNLLTIKHADLVDVIDVGGNGPWPTMSAGYFAWTNRELAKVRLPGESPALWDAEARCEPRLVRRKQMSFHPNLVVPDGAKILRMVKRKTDPRHDEAVAWYRAEQARICVKVFVTRFAAGAEKVFMGMPSDWDGTPAALMAPNPYIGLLDRKCQPWPAFYAMKLLVTKLDGFARAERMPAEKGMELYRFTFADGRPAVRVAWLAEDTLRGLDDPLPKRRVTLRSVQGPVRVQPAPTTSQLPQATRFTGPGPLTVDLTPTPLIIERGS